MARNLSSLIVQIQNHLIKTDLPDSLHIFFYQDINSTQENHRTTLRQHLIQELQSVTNQLDVDQLLDLNRRPQTDDYSISVSHSPNSSICAFIDSHFSIGIDTEIKTRIKPPVISRIAKESEVKLCPQPEFLFCAKEAAWKALNHSLNISTISQIETTNWLKLESQWQQFNVQIDGNIIDGFGFIHEISGSYISFYYTPSTFVLKHRQK